MDNMMTGMMQGQPAQPQANKLHDADPVELERMMAEQVKKNAPDDVAEFMQEIQQDGVTPEEIDEVRQLTLAALSDPSQFEPLTTYLVNSELIEQEDIPEGYDGGFVLSILGLVGVAEELVTQSQPQ